VARAALGRQKVKPALDAEYWSGMQNSSAYHIAPIPPATDWHLSGGDIQDCVPAACMPPSAVV
jgi:hypothetical protein